MTEVHSRGRTARNHWKVLRSQAGAFDLPSIITGVVVVGILAAGVLAAIFGVIPFSQDKAAQQDLDAVRTAQGVAKSQLGGFKNKAGLLSNSLMGDSPSLGVTADDDGTCYVGVSKSGTGKVYFSTNKVTEPKLLTATTDTECVDPASLGTIINAIGGLPAAGPSGDPTAAPGGTSGTPTSYDWDGDRAETNQRLAGFGGNWAHELGTTADTQSATGSIIQGALAGQRIGLLSENTGSYHACGTLESSGELYCWGDNWRGQLGIGEDRTEESEPVKVIGLDGKVISQVITNGYNTCAIADGAPYCWGSYSLISDDNVVVPTAVDTAGVLAGKTITKLVGGNQFACVLADGTPYCWGANNSGELGIGTYGVQSYTPVAVNTSGALAGKTITDLGASNGGPCAIADGAAFCWGRGDSGTMGNGTRLTENPLPVAVQGLEGMTVTAIAGGYSNTCAVADGAAYCWGNRTGDYANMVGDGTMHPYSYDAPYDSNYQMVPQAVDTSGALSGKTVTHVDMGDNHVCVIANEAPYCWGTWESTDPGSDEYGYVETFSPVSVGGSTAAGARTVGLWTEGGSTIFSYIKS
ncbi:hypothetical protein [Arthrobacter sp. UYCo732]|uniref:RCC1 domain-containing protein n=1 Tax=Arthrobacter sp. UYCo732 TaxID=3156336 RepID=UPI0033986B62